MQTYSKTEQTEHIAAEPKKGEEKGIEGMSHPAMTDYPLPPPATEASGSASGSGIIQRKAATSGADDGINGISYSENSAVKQLYNVDLHARGAKMETTSPSDKRLTSVGARSLTQGGNALLGHSADRYHEMQHMVQQHSQKIPATKSINGFKVNTSKKLEHDADRGGERIRSLSTQLASSGPALTTSTQGVAGGYSSPGVIQRVHAKDGEHFSDILTGQKIDDRKGVLTAISRGSFTGDHTSILVEYLDGGAPSTWKLDLFYDSRAKKIVIKAIQMESLTDVTGEEDLAAKASMSGLFLKAEKSRSWVKTDQNAKDAVKFARTYAEDADYATINEHFVYRTKGRKDKRDKKAPINCASFGAMVLKAGGVKDASAKYFGVHMPSQLSHGDHVGYEEEKGYGGEAARKELVGARTKDLKDRHAEKVRAAKEEEARREREKREALYTVNLAKYGNIEQKDYDITFSESRGSLEVYWVDIGSWMRFEFAPDDHYTDLAIRYHQQFRVDKNAIIDGVVTLETIGGEALLAKLEDIFDLGTGAVIT